MIDVIFLIVYENCKRFLLQSLDKQKSSPFKWFFIKWNDDNKNTNLKWLWMGRQHYKNKWSQSSKEFNSDQPQCIGCHVDWGWELGLSLLFITSSKSHKLKSRYQVFNGRLLHFISKSNHLNIFLFTQIEPVVLLQANSAFQVCKIIKFPKKKKTKRNRNVVFS